MNVSGGSPTPSPDAEIMSSEDRLPKLMKILVIAACSFIFLMFGYLLIRYFTKGTTSSDRRRSGQREEGMSSRGSRNYIQIIEARSDTSFNNSTWNSSSEIPVVIVNVGEDGKACLGWAEDELDSQREQAGVTGGASP